MKLLHAVDHLYVAGMKLVSRWILGVHQKLQARMKMSNRAPKVVFDVDEDRFDLSYAVWYMLLSDTRFTLCVQQ